MLRSLCCCLALGTSLLHVTGLQAQPAPEKEAPVIQAKLDELQQAVADLKKSDADPRLIADVEVYAKAAEWCVRHNEFYKPDYAQAAIKALDTGLARARDLKSGNSPWAAKPGTSIRGYVSKVDGSVQPYALTLPEGFDPKSSVRQPLHVVLHGRGDTLNEVAFIRQHDGKPAAADRTWVQLDVYARGNNAYRWAGETDVFEAMADLKRTVRVDERRITLRGFSMGGAGAWHLGLHYPSLWSSVGPGAGFVDFYKYTNAKQKLPEYQDKALHIYNAIDYALNAANVPVITYGGELDKQLLASTSMVEEAKKHGVDIRIIIGPQTGHKFHPESEKEFMAAHAEHSQKGRKPFPGLEEVRFTTHTLKYNRCEWLTIEEVLQMYKPAVVEGKIDRNGTLHLKTENVAVLRLSRDAASDVRIDGKTLPLYSAADSLLPDVYYELGTKEWYVMDYDTSRAFPDNDNLRKRHDLQGPIDDAFMQPFVCVRGTREPWNADHQAWADWTLARFEREFDKWMRGRVRTVDDSKVTDELIADHNLILFGDPGSNSVLAKIIDKLPVKWTKDGLEVDGETYDPSTHGLALIYPNPLNRRRYVVINSGHTFHEKDFRGTNALLFPRLGDIAVQTFERSGEGYTESVVWAAMFNPSWKLPPRD